MTRTRFFLAAFLLSLPVSASELAGQNTGSTGQPDDEAGATLTGQQFLRAFEVIKSFSWNTPADSTLWRGAFDGLMRSAILSAARIDSADFAQDSTGVLATAPVRPSPGSVDGRQLLSRFDSIRRSGPRSVDDQRFLSAFDSIRRSGPDAPDDPVLWRGSISGLIGALDDPYGQVLSPRLVDEFQEQTTGNYAGIGVAIQQLNDRITVTAVFRGFPAERVGIQVGDVIVGVDGESTDGWTTGAASERIRGTPGTMVTVSVERDGFSAPIPHDIERDNIHVSSVHAGYMDEDIGYIQLDRVARGSTEEMDSAFALLADARGIVLDLRRNPGGYLDESLTLTDLFLDRGKRIVSTRGRNPRRGPGEHEDAVYTRDRASVGDKPLVVLVDGFTASAGEILSGALQDHDRALVVGERTFGKGVVQSVVPLPEGWQLQLTTGEWYTPLGRSLHRQRDAQGLPLPEDSTAFPVFTTEGGRELRGGGGVFPDLQIAGDTLLVVERQLLEEARDAEFPFGLRLAEIGFDRSQAVSNDGAEAIITDEILEAFIADMREAGVPEATVGDPAVRDYLLWRLEIALSQRMDDERLLRFRIQRDPVLAEAVRLVRESDTQAELFRLAGGGS
ncbi:MAG: S41 family peptidase [Gammaproteobacteria bacterium]|nr:S41 family peptidase [Gammaproteobacteria bacterium]